MSRKMNTGIKQIFVLAFVIAALTSCEYKYVEPMNTQPPDSVSFSLDIQPVFNANCIGCHSGPTPTGSLDLSAGSSYDALMSNNLIESDTANAANSVLYMRITNTGTSSGPMPPSGILAASKTDLVLQWIREGAKNN